jgi:sodium-dependent dicarboxylate transporter 2/3/5
MNVPPGSNYGMAMFLGIAWASNLGSTLTPGGTPTNLITIGLLEPTGYRIGYAQWFMGSVVFTLLQLLAMFLVIRYFLRGESSRYEIPRERLLDELREMGPLTRGEKIAATALGIALLLWITPEMSSLILGRTHPMTGLIYSRLNWGLVGILVGMGLFLIPVDWKSRRFVVQWGEATQQVELGTMALIAGALAVGETVGDRQIGLGEYFIHSVSSLAAPDTSRYIFLLITLIIAVVLTNLVSNLVGVSFLTPIIINVAPPLGLNPVALAVVVSLGSCAGYSLPSANPPCAIVFASGYLRIFPMFVRGMILSLVAIVLLTFIGYPIANWVFPWPLPTS